MAGRDQASLMAGLSPASVFDTKQRCRFYRRGCRALLVVIATILIAVPCVSLGGSLFRQPLGQSRFLVLVTCDDTDMAAYCAAMLETALCRSSGFAVVDRETVQAIKTDAIMLAKLNAADPSALKEIDKKYSVDYQVNGKLTTDRKRLVSQYEGSALLTVEVIRTTDGIKMGQVARSREVGVPGNPGPMRGLALPAAQAAVTLVTNDVIGQLSLPGGFEPENVIQLGLKRVFDMPLEHPGAAVAISGKNQCYAGMDRTILRFSLDTGAQGRMDCESPVTALAVWPDSRFLASGHDDGSVCVWDLTAERLLWRNTNNNKAIACVVVLPETDGIAAGTANGMILIFERGTNQIKKQWLAHPRKPVHSLGFTYDGQFLLSAGADRYVHKWRIGDTTSVFSFREIATANNRDRGELLAAEFTREGNVVAVAMKDIDIDLMMNQRTDREYVCLHNCETCPPDEEYRFEGHDEAIDCLKLCPTSCRFLASGSRDGKVKIWDMNTRSSVFEEHVGGWIQDMAFSPQGNWFAVVTRKGKGAFDKQKNQILRVWQAD